MADQVIGTRGKLVKFEIRGVNQVLNILRRKKFQIITAKQVSTAQAAGLIEEQVKLSIAGKKAETRSVDTGKFINSVNIRPVSKDSVEVFSDVSYAPALEFGTSRMIERRHFRNTLARNKDKIKQNFKINIKLFSAK